MQNLNKTKPIQSRYIHLKRKLKTYFNAKLIGIGHEANCQCFYFGLGLPVPKMHTGEGGGLEGVKVDLLSKIFKKLVKKCN